MAVEDRPSQALYGNADGHWLFVGGPYDTIPPPTITVGLVPGRTTTLTYLGTVSEVMTRLALRLKEKLGPEAPVQQLIANALGVHQQSVSLYINGHNSRLNGSQLRQLVLMHFNENEPQVT
jgi:hypothetical protein